MLQRHPQILVPAAPAPSAHKLRVRACGWGSEHSALTDARAAVRKELFWRRGRASRSARCRRSSRRPPALRRPPRAAAAPCPWPRLAAPAPRSSARYSQRNPPPRPRGPRPLPRPRSPTHAASGLPTPKPHCSSRARAASAGAREGGMAGGKQRERGGFGHVLLPAPRKPQECTACR